MSNQNKPVRIGIVGCGAVVREMHLAALVQCPNVEVTYLCDRVESFRTIAKQEYGLDSAKMTADYQDFKGEVDAAIVAVPPKFHCPVTCDLLDMGIHVLCEKPIAMTTAEAQQMMVAAKKNDRILTVGFMTRYMRSARMFAEIVRDPLIGEIQEVIAESGTKMGWTMTSDAYYNKAMTIGGTFYDSGIHVIDRVLWQFGELDEVDYEDDSYGGVETNAVLRGKLTIDGRKVPCRMAFSWTHLLSNAITVIGSAGTLEVSLRGDDLLFVTRTVNGKPVRFKVEFEGATPNPTHSQALEFVAAIRENRQPFITAESATRPLTLIEKAYSVRTPMVQPWVEAEGPLN